LGVVAAIERVCREQAEIKWPNDVLVNRKKVCGVLVEPSWLGNELQAVVTGIGVNVSSQAVPPADTVRFPATSLEDEVGNPVDRWMLLRAILQEMIDLRPILGKPDFYQAWGNHLAYKGEWVKLSSGYAGDQEKVGTVIGIDMDGSLRLRDSQGKESTLNVGEVHLSPLDSP
jgi:BirA family biotin operon repressor/biotin-[acetyl-CoA-carboxylase] ligase